MFERKMNEKIRRSEWKVLKSSECNQNLKNQLNKIKQNGIERYIGRKELKYA